MPQAPKLLSGLVELLFPEYNACHLCGRYPERAGLLCQRCAGELRALSYRRLHAVSPQPHPPLQLCLSAYPHSGEARQLVHLLKYQSDGAVARVLGEAMAGALVRGKVACYMADVLGTEPPAADNPLLGAPNTLLTPHVAWAPRQTRERLLDIAVGNVRAFLAGTPRNVVSC